MHGSLRFRLASAAVASIAVALVIAGFGLSALFERHVIRRVEAELDTHLRQLAGDLNFTADGTLQVAREPADPRFDQPLSGLYWQVSDLTLGASLRSRSLWDHALELPPRSTQIGSIERHMVPGRAGETLIVADRTVDYPFGAGSRPVRLAAAIDRRDIVRAREAFTTEAALALLLLACVLMVAAWMQIAVGLKPLEAVRRSVNRVRSGLEPRIAVGEPSEVMPLVAEVNSLLDAQDKAIEQARRRAADLAHALKSPLQVLAMDAERLRAKGETHLADEIEELAGGMRRHIGRELSRARLQNWATVAGLRTPVGEVVERVARTLARTPKGQLIRFDLEVDAAMVAAMPEPDLMELVGNLLDNAVKWAVTEVRVRGAGSTGLALVIEDDGPGVSPEMLTRLGQRGLRLDETVEGTGLGLAIASDIAEAYGSGLVFANRETSGLRVAVLRRATPTVVQG